ncbi:metallophosphoesterase family protein [Cohnella yongneupensis]|uniref:Exonuclease SbcCD subunit D n=1 Tax=Cohnella yongneupensis TaxID=425006 RepID=A0ABW0QXL9_9BACL
MGVPFTFMHAADLHLDSPFKSLAKAPEAVRSRLREATFAALRRLVDAAKREKVDFVVLSGDLYDAADRSLRAQLRLQRALTELTEQGIEVFAVHGNHDPESGRQAMLDPPPGLFVFGSDDVGCLPAHARGGEVVANVYGISYPNAAVTDNLALRFVRSEGATFHIAVLHANVDGDPAHDNYAPCRLDELVAAGFDYWALGHVHGRRVLHEYPHVVYPGNLQGRSIRETDSKGAYIVKVSSTGGVEMKFVDVADVLWRESVISIAGIEREQELKERLLAAVEEMRMSSQGRPVVARLRLEGRGALHERLLEPSVAEEWLAELRDWVGAPDDAEGDWLWPEAIAVRTSSLLRLEAAAEEEGFVGEMLRIGLEASDDEERSSALFKEALESLRKQPALRGWLDSRSHEERAEWIRQAMELSVSLLREEQ